VLLAAPAPGAASDRERDFGTVTLGMTGGFQLWTLPSLEKAVARRAEDLAQDAYLLPESSYDLTFSYGGEIQVRLDAGWFARAQLEWTRLRLEDRDRQFLQFLGSRERTPVSVSYSTRVETRPLLAALGLGRAWRGESVRLGLAASLIVAPIKVVDEIGVFLESDTVSEVTATGTGLGGELSASLDYFTDANMTLYLELFGRTGGTDVELDDRSWESTILPGTRRVDLEATGIRLGFRWI